MPEQILIALGNKVILPKMSLFLITALIKRTPITQDGRADDWAKIRIYLAAAVLFGAGAS